MLFNVPQFIDIEDKIVGPLTAKQLGWIALGGVILLILFGSLDMQAFIIGAVIVGVIVGALAFYRPYGQPLIKFTISSIVFFMRPKIYIWRRLSGSIAPSAKVKNKVVKTIPKTTLDNQNLSEISHLLDMAKK
jgi:membrane protein implicated in regulation of membrane protease activity